MSGGRSSPCLICAVAGIIVGVLVKVFGDHSGIFAELMQDFGRTGRFKYRQAPGMVVTAFVSLAAGGSLGPEAPMADACGSVATWTADRLKMDERSTRSLGFSGIGGMLGAFVTSPFSGALLGLESARAAISFPWLLFPSLVAAAVSTTTFVLLSGAFFGSLYVFPEYTPHLTDLAARRPPRAWWERRRERASSCCSGLLRKLMEPMRKHVILRGLLGGLGLGVAGAFFPLVLFSGEEQTGTLISDAATIGIVTLIVLAVLKLVVTGLLLTTGWKGGYIFPTMFAGVALGLATNLIFPSIPVAVAVAATMAGAMVVTMKAPLFTALFTAMLVQREAGPVIAIAVIVGLLATVRLSMVRPPAEQPGRGERGRSRPLRPGNDLIRRPVDSGDPAADRWGCRRSRQQLYGDDPLSARSGAAGYRRSWHSGHQRHRRHHAAAGLSQHPYLPGSRMGQRLRPLLAADAGRLGLHPRHPIHQYWTGPLSIPGRFSARTRTGNGRCSRSQPTRACSPTSGRRPRTNRYPTSSRSRTPTRRRRSSRR